MSCYKSITGCGVYKNRSCNKCPYSKQPKNNFSEFNVAISSTVKSLATCEKEIEKHKEAIRKLEEEKESLTRKLNRFERSNFGT